MDAESPLQIGRRAFLKQGTLLLATGAASASWGACGAWAGEPTAPLRFGLVTDLHYADKPAAGSRHYRDTPAKLAEAAQQFAAQPLDFLAELGDLIDAADSVSAEQGFLRRINRDFSAICPQRHYVLGNHCVHTLTKPPQRLS